MMRSFKVCKSGKSKHVPALQSKTDASKMFLAAAVGDPNEKVLPENGYFYQRQLGTFT